MHSKSAKSWFFAVNVDLKFSLLNCSQVLDQGMCASCYAHAAASAYRLEAAINLN